MGVAIKWFVGAKFPDEHRLHEVHNDWHRCTLTRQKLLYWKKKYTEKIQKPTEIDLAKIERKRSNLPKIKLSLYNSHQLASKAIELKRLGDGRFFLNARAWFLKYNYPKEYKLFDNVEENVDSAKRRNYAWAKYLDDQPNLEAEETISEVENDLIELTLVHDQFEFQPTFSSTPTKRPIQVASPKTPVLFSTQLQAKKHISRKRLFKNC